MPGELTEQFKRRKKDYWWARVATVGCHSSDIWNSTYGTAHMEQQWTLSQMVRHTRWAHLQTVRIETPAGEVVVACCYPSHGTVSSLPLSCLGDILVCTDWFWVPFTRTETWHWDYICTSVLWMKIMTKYTSKSIQCATKKTILKPPGIFDQQYPSHYITNIYLVPSCFVCIIQMKDVSLLLNSRCCFKKNSRKSVKTYNKTQLVSPWSCKWTKTLYKEQNEDH